MEELLKMQAAIFGTGIVALRIYKELIEKHGEEKVAFFIDSMLKKDSFCGKPVYGLEELKELDVNQYMYYFGSISSQNSMKAELLKIGVNPENMYKKRDYSEDGFCEKVLDVKSVLIYPVPQIEKKIELEEKIRRYLGNYYNDIIIDYEKNKEIADYDLIIVWNKNNLEDIELDDNDKVFCIDNEFYRTIEQRIMIRLCNILAKKKRGNYYVEQSKKIFESLKHMSIESAYIFASGPSLSEGVEIFKKKSKAKYLTGVCNGFILGDEELINEVKPNLYFLVDMIWVGKRCEPFMTKICEYIKNNDCYLVVPEYWVPMLIEKYGIDGKVIGLDLTAKEITIPKDKLIVYNKATNVITTMAVPICSALADEIYFTGCDGAKRDEENKGNWGHSVNVDLNFQALPDDKADYDYLEKHELYFEEIVSYGENIGKKYHTLTKSYIPCLQDRYDCI